MHVDIVGAGAAAFVQVSGLTVAVPYHGSDLGAIKGDACDEGVEDKLLTGVIEMGADAVGSTVQVALRCLEVTATADVRLLVIAIEGR